MTPPVPPTRSWPDVLRRLRARPASSWRHGDREAVARAATQRLADLAAEADATEADATGADAGEADPAEAAGEPKRSVPDVGVAALPDQLAVLMADAQRAGVDAVVLADIADQLAAELSVNG